MSQSWMSSFLGYESDEAKDRKKALEQRLIPVSEEDFQRGVALGEVEDNPAFLKRHYRPASSPRRRDDGTLRPPTGPLYIPAGLNPTLELRGTARVLIFSWDHDKMTLCGKVGRGTSCIFPDFIEKLQKYVLDIAPDIFFYAGQKVGLDHHNFIELLADRLPGYKLLTAFYGTEGEEDMASVVFVRAGRDYVVEGKQSRQKPFHYHQISLLVPYRATETAEIFLYNVENKSGGLVSNYWNQKLNAVEAEKYLEEDAAKTQIGLRRRTRVVLVAGDLMSRAGKNYWDSKEKVAPRSTELEAYFRKDSLARERRWREDRLFFKEGPGGLGPFFMPSCPLKVDRSRRPDAKTAVLTGKRMNLRDYDPKKEDSAPSWCGRILYSSFAPPPPVHVREYNNFDFGDAMYASPKAAVVGVFDLEL